MSKKSRADGLTSFISLLVVLCAAMLFAYHIRIVTFRYPLEFREGAMMQTTHALLVKENPYAVENQPQDTNVYGIFYSIMCYPFAKIFGVSLLVHRFVAAIFILLSCLVVFLFARSEGHPILPSFTAAALLYASLLYNQTPLARPDSLGLFLFLSSLYIPQRYKYSSGSLLASSIIGAFAFFTKTFFLLGCPFVGSYLFLFVSKKKGVIYSAFSIILLLMSALAVNSFLETYIADVLFNHMNVARYDVDYLSKQLSFGVKSFAVLFFVPALATVTFVRKRRKPIREGSAGASFLKSLLPAVDVRNYDRPFFLNHIKCTPYYFICAVLVFCLKLGGHDGAWMTYFYQLIAPFFLLMLLGVTSHSRSSGSYLSFMLAGTVNLGAFYGAVLPHYSVQDVQSQWEQIRSLVHDSTSIYNSPAIAPLLLEQNKQVFDSGQSEYFKRSQFPREFSFLSRYSALDRRIRRQLKLSHQEIIESVKSGKYDVILITERKGGSSPVFLSKSLLQPHYEKKNTLNAPMPHTMQNWTLEVWTRKQ